MSTGAGLTPEQSAHFSNLQDCYTLLLDAAEDPDTPADAQGWLDDAITAVRGQIDDLDAIAYGSNTVQLQAAAADLQSSVAVLKKLKSQLDADAAWVARLTSVANALDAAISTASSLGIPT